MRRGHTNDYNQSRKFPDKMKKPLNEAKRASTPENHRAIASLIASGRLTRDRCCDGKKRYITYDYAIGVRDRILEELQKTQYVYACPFCSGFHLASLAEVSP